MFFSGVALYGANYAQGKFEESLLRRAYCVEAKKYGDSPLLTGQRGKKVTVFLNPAAKNGRGKKFFDMNVAPILHLAGFEITVVKTEYEGQAKKYMEVIEPNTEAIVVAGGDGTLLEVITGLLRREDADAFANVPIGFMPLGYTNTLAQDLTFQGNSDVQWQVEAAMAVVKGITKPVDVLHIKGSEGKNVFALSGLEWGILTDVKKRKKKNWYMSILKHRYAYIRETLRPWPPLMEGQLSYTSPCEGCSKCYVAPPEPQWKWWHLFLPPQRHVPLKDYSQIENVECGVVHEEKVSTIQLDIKPSKDDKVNAVMLEQAPSDISRVEFIKAGWQREKEPSSNNLTETIINAQNLVFTPVGKDEKPTSYTIDNEDFEIMPIEVNLLKGKVNMFCSQLNEPFVKVESVEG